MLRSKDSMRSTNSLSLSLSRVALGLSSFLFAFTFISGSILISSFSFADDTAIDDISITVPVACTMSGTGMNSHNATINPGTTNSAVGTTTLNVLCNDLNGFAVYAIGYTNETYGDNTLTSTTLSPAQTIATGTGTTGNSQWAMKLETDANATYPVTIMNSFDAFHNVPDDYTMVARRLSGTDVGTAAVGSTLTSTYQVHIASTQAADTYNGKVKYTMVHPNNETPPVDVACANNKICYNANTNIKEGTMGQQSGNANASVTLLASNFSKNGYGFAGWNTKPDYSGTFYGPNETITTPADMSAGLPLYAVWVASSGSLQGWGGCSSLIKADEATDILSQSIRALTDQRDGQTYAVAKLADGQCWMIENLRLEADDSSDSTLARGFGGVFTGLADAEAAWANNSTTANSLYSTDGSTANTISGSNQGYRFPRYNNINTSTRASSPTSGTNVNIYSYGNYYTWSAAMANTESLTSYSASEAANTSLCPTGWRLPTGGNKARIEADDNNEFWNLIVDELNGGTNPANYSSSTAPYYNGSAEAGPVDKLIRSYPNNFLRSGDVNGGSVNSRGSYSSYWSSSADSTNYAYSLFFYSAYVGPGTGSYVKYVGSSVRCVSI